MAAGVARLCSIGAAVTGLGLLVGIASFQISSTAKAQSNIGGFFGLLDEAIREHQRHQRQKKDQHDQIVAIQSVLARLNCYHGSLDGKFGPASERALADCMRAFELPHTPGQLSIQHYRELERMAEQEFHSKQEFRDANRLGFRSGADYRQHLDEMAAESQPYEVEGQALGARIDLTRPEHDDFRCSPSRLFPSFVWCQKRRETTSGRDKGYVGHSLLQGKDGNAYYMFKTESPPAFGASNIDQELASYKKRYGSKFERLDMPATSGYQRALIAKWGDLTLQPLSALERDAIAAGDNSTGTFLIDFIDDWPRSVKLGLPIYKVTKGAGFVWNVHLTEKGRLTSNVRMVNATSLIEIAARERAEQDRARRLEEERIQREEAEERRQREEEQRRQEEAELDALRQKASSAREMLQEYEKSGRKPDDPLGVAKANARLIAALRTNGKHEIEQALRSFRAALDAEPSYLEFLAYREEERARQRRKALEREQGLSRSVIAFIEWYLSNNLTFERADTLVNIQLRVERSLKSDTQVELAAANEEAKESIRLAGLEKELGDYLDRQNRSDPDASDRYRRLLGRGAGEFVVLVNNSASAPNTKKDLTGKLVFERATAVTCWYHPPPPRDLAVRMVLDKVRALGAESLRIQGTCDQTRFPEGYDLVVLNVGEFQKLDLPRHRRLFGQPDRGDLVEFASLTQSDVDHMVAEREALRRSIETELENRTRTGFGLLLFANAEPYLCRTALEDGISNEDLLRTRASELVEELGGRVEVVEVSTEDAFTRAQRRKCGGIYGNHHSLAELIKASKREQIPFQIVPAWFAPSPGPADGDRYGSPDRPAAIQPEPSAPAHEEGSAGESAPHSRPPYPFRVPM